MHNCDDIFEHIYEFINTKDMTAEMEAEIRVHLQMCRKCYTHFEFERLLIQRFRDAGCPSCPETLKHRIKDILDRF